MQNRAASSYQSLGSTKLIQRVARIFEFLDNATDDEMEELAALAEGVRIHGHYTLVNEFLDRYQITDHEEAANLYFLFGIMDYADLQFDEAPEED